ncbi:MAG: 3-oxoacyl-ACP synthase [Bacteroidia bacterium]|nr:3-oxoacyl-ACP synthase [Bacteroidia bacterium]NND11362.1 3-oxoacyl-ACP synthase [Flavobacteriaceae bacterium]MBT8310802.1 3-oxoacyl-ACP synthase [Bacteroidia bacterium]NNK28957.1 3-oxoacyl-ACP synthase [Flavobacteriaceae bacterium]NNL60222.1 3-oxoacyl-ACP synthase [Flavobacteriaceae bacterium]
MNIKKALFKHCLEFVQNRHNTIVESINQIQLSLLSETKSSAGDKHETGRAMLQLEREKAGAQLAEIQKIKETLLKIDITSAQQIIGLGSVIYTQDTNYFIAISAGELKVNNEEFFAISAGTPIGKLLIGKSKGDLVSFRDRKICIINVY